MAATSLTLTRMFDPEAIAVIGASSTPGKAGHEMLQALTDFPGMVYAVNPRVGTVLGMPAYAHITDIAETIDLAIVTLPASKCLAVVRDCAAAQVGALMIISGGFAESGSDGEALQDEIITICRANGIRLLGPNTSGFANPRGTLAANFAPGMQDLNAGPVAIVSQSGAVTLALSALAVEQRIGVGLAVGTGNGGDVVPSDVLSYLAQREDVRVIALYLEGVSDGRRLYDAVSRVTPHKPVLIYTVGKADIGDFAASHTGNLIGSYALKTSALQQSGAVIVDSLESLIDTAKVLSITRLPPKADPSVALITGQAGPGMIISDYLKAHGISLPKLQPATVASIAKLLPPLTYQLNPVDTGRPGETFGRVFSKICRDPGIDVAIGFALHEPAAINPLEMIRSISNYIDDTKASAVIFGTAGQQSAVAPTLTALNAMGIPALPSPDRIARAVRYLIEDAKHAHRQIASVSSNYARTTADADLPAKISNEWAAKQCLAKIGIPSPAGRLCKTHEEALQAYTQLQRPVVVKLSSTNIGHKTEVGGVFLNTDTEKKLLTALGAIDAIPNASDRRYLLEAQAPPGLDMILGATRDASFGPTVLVGIGGTQAEALDDVSIRLAPLSEFEAESMLEELRAFELLNGWRGAPALDKAGLVRAIVAIGQLISNNPPIAEIDVNPLRVYSEGLLALDGFIVASTRSRTADQPEAI